MNSGISQLSTSPVHGFLCCSHQLLHDENHRVLTAFSRLLPSHSLYILNQSHNFVTILWALLPHPALKLFWQKLLQNQQLQDLLFWVCLRPQPLTAEFSEFAKTFIGTSYLLMGTRCSSPPLPRSSTAESAAGSFVFRAVACHGGLIAVSCVESLLRDGCTWGLFIAVMLCFNLLAHWLSLPSCSSDSISYPWEAGLLDTSEICLFGIRDLGLS